MSVENPFEGEPQNESNKPFNIETEVSEKDWEKIDEMFRYSVWKDEPILAADMAWRLDLLGRPVDPQLLDKYNARLTEKLRKMYENPDKDEKENERRKKAGQVLQSVYPMQHTANTLDMKMLEKGFAPSEDDMKRIKKELKEVRDLGRFEDMFYGFAAEKILGTKEFTMPKFDKSDIEEELSQHDDPRAWLRVASSLRILGYDIKSIQVPWDKIRQEWNAEEYQDGYWKLMMLTDMAILQADEVRIPEGGGLELINQKKEVE
jgi:hypothetical protein